jgi:hypothetical protein
MCSYVKKFSNPTNCKGAQLCKVGHVAKLNTVLQGGCRTVHQSRLAILREVGHSMVHPDHGRGEGQKQTYCSRVGHKLSQGHGPHRCARKAFAAGGGEGKSQDPAPPKTS